jgi:hypothetical protein
LTTDFELVFIFERDRELYCMIEWFYTYKMKRIEKDVYRFPSVSLYKDETIQFKRNQSGAVTHLELQGIVFKRKPVGKEPGGDAQLPGEYNLRNFAEN